MTTEERNALAEAIFKDEVTFEKQVLDIQNETDRKEVMLMLADEIVKVQLRDELHFAYLKSYDDLKTDGIIKVILQRVSSEAGGYLEEKLRFTKTMTLQTIRKTPNLLFLKRLSLYYYKRYAHMIFERVADSFFEKVAMLPSPEKVPAVLREAVEGSAKRPPIFKGNAVSFEHIWKHVRKASAERKREVGKVQISLASIISIKQNETLDAGNEAKLDERYRENQKQLEAVREKPLSEFDGSIRQMKKALVETLENF
jgi:hypothetical protein